MILAEHLAEKFNAELGDGGDDVRKNPKAMAKLIRQARYATVSRSGRCSLRKLCDWQLCGSLQRIPAGSSLHLDAIGAGI